MGEQLELHGGQLARVSILAAKGVTSRLGARPGGFAVLNMCGEDHLPINTQDIGLLCEFGQTALTLAPIFASVDIYGSVEGVRSSQSELFTSLTSKAN